MRIATFNINGIKARLPRLIEWLEETQPDVACLQEIKTSDDTFPMKDIEAAGYGAIWHGQKGFNGVAILARGQTPVEIQRGLDGEPEDEHSRYIEADIQGVRVASIYLPNGNPVPGPKFEYKLRWMQRLRARAAEIWAEEVPAVLAGDYNVIPREVDCHNPAVWTGDALFQPETRAAYRALLNLGVRDAYMQADGAAHRYTFWDYQAGAWQKDHGIRIDHLLLSPQAADTLDGVAIFKKARGLEKASDHVPIVATFG